MTRRARAFSAKALLAAGLATALGGVAVAATTGGLTHLPGGLGGGPEAQAPMSALPSASAPWSGRPSGQPFEQRSTSPSATGAKSARPEPSPSTPAGPVPSTTPPGVLPGTPAAQAELERLCRTFTERLQAGDRVKTLVADPAFAPLVSEAGESEKVQEYCVRLVGAAASGGKPSPGKSAKADPSTGHPTKAAPSAAG
ncbi:hypothetical protein ACFQ0T_22620 [Kitasatospora gansuensis]